MSTWRSSIFVTVLLTSTALAQTDPNALLQSDGGVTPMKGVSVSVATGSPTAREADPVVTMMDADDKSGRAGSDAAASADGADAPVAATATPGAALAPAPEPVSNRRPTPDPEMDNFAAHGVVPGTPVAGTWNENANKLYYDSTIQLPWQHTLGDYAPTPLGAAQLPNTRTRTVITLAVKGNNFYLKNGGGGTAYIDSREAVIGAPPTLIVNGTDRYVSTRDTALFANQFTPVGTSVLLDDLQAVLIAFDGYTPKPDDKAVLQLTAERSYGAHTLTAYAPDVHYFPPTPGDAPGGVVVVDKRAADFKPGPHLSVSADTVTGYWEGTSQTAVAQVWGLPPADEYFLTVVIKLEQNWSNQGGKLPGLSNTGMVTNHSGSPFWVDGINCSNAGWGGRVANGCRWSARTGWYGRSADQVGMHSYFYAVAPQNGYGITQPLQIPAPVGQWFAYVERVKVNTPGQNDGRLTYWVCTQQGCAAVLDRSDIDWRTYDLPQSKINELWADVFCGGLSCGPAPWPRSTVDLKRLTVTTGLPDLGALASEVQGLAGQ